MTTQTDLVPREYALRDANIEFRSTSQPTMTSVPASIAYTLSEQERVARPAETTTQHRWVEEVMAREGDGITRMLWRLLHNEADVLDAFQDTFCKLAQRGGKVDLRSARAYAYRTATNTGIELIRARQRHHRHHAAIASRARRVSCEEPHDPGRLVDSIGNDRLRGAIGRLPPHLHGVVVLRDLGRMPYDEIGRVLNIDPATARVYRRHAIVRLSELLSGEEES